MGRRARSAVPAALWALAVVLGSLAGDPTRIAGLLPTGPAAALAQPPVTLGGVLTIVYGDPLPGQAGAPTTNVFLTDDGGQQYALVLDAETALPPRGLLGLNGRRVEVTAEVAPAPRAADGGAAPAPPLRVRSIVPAPGVSGPADVRGALLGTQKYVTILCRFSDYAGVTPVNVPFFQQMLGSTSPGVTHFWQESSYNQITVDATTILGWYTLPQPLSYYWAGGGTMEDFRRASHACADQADALVYYPDYVGINFVFNVNFSCCAWGGTIVLTLDGVTRVWGGTWMPPGGFIQRIFAHEMGHAFGLPHSANGLGTTYRSRWDVMSGGGQNCSNADPTLGCVGTDTIAHHKDLLGWVPADRRYVPAPNSDQTVTLERWAQPPGTSGSYRMIRVPYGSGTERSYTAELRRFAGYDVNVPGEGVVLHTVDTTWVDDAWVLDADGNADTTDGGAIWLPGETFTDPFVGVTFDVVSSDANGVRVRVRRGPAPPNNFADARDVGTLPARFQAVTDGATTEPGEPGGAASLTCPDGAAAMRTTLWYSFTAPSPGTLTLNTTGSGVETRLAVYTGNALNALTQVGCSNPPGAGPASLSVPVATGTRYLIQLGTPSADARAGVQLDVDGPRPPRLDLGAAAGGALRTSARGSLTFDLSNEAGAPTATLPLALSVTLPEGLRFASGEGAGWTCGASGANVTCTSPGPLAAGASARVTLHVDVLATAPAAASVCATATTLGSTANDCAQLAIERSRADLGLTLTAAAPTVLVDQTLLYTATVTNAGPHPATNALLTVSPSAGAAVLSGVGGDCTLEADAVTCRLPTLPAGGAGAQVALTVRAPGGVGPFDVAAGVVADEQDANPNNNAARKTADAVTACDPRPPVRVVTTPGPGGTLTVAIAAGRGPIRTIRVGSDARAVVNGLVDFPNGPSGVRAATWTVPGAPPEVRLTVRRTRR